MNLPHSLLVLASAAAEAAKPSPFVEMIVLLTPLLVILLVMFVVLRPLIARSHRVQDRSMEHMDRIEAKTDEMIELLRAIGDRLDGGGS